MTFKNSYNSIYFFPLIYHKKSKNQIKEMNYNEQYYVKPNDENRDEYEIEQLIETTEFTKEDFEF